MLVDGVNAAGLFTTLTKPDFTIEDITKDATEIAHGSHRGQGIHLWVVQRTNGDVEVYIGRSNNFRRRFIGNTAELKETGGRTHIKACQDADSVAMYELCVLEYANKQYWYSFCEQIFVSLLETYYPPIIVVSAAFEADVMSSSTGTHTEGNYDRVAATRLDQIAKLATKKGNWCDFAKRTSSGVTKDITSSHR
jgi:hypothetical protein